MCRIFGGGWRELGIRRNKRGARVDGERQRGLNCKNKLRTLVYMGAEKKIIKNKNAKVEKK